MAHLVDKDALVVEIEKRRKEWQYGSSTEAKFKREECDDILSFINTLEVKEVDLEKELKKKIGNVGECDRRLAEHFFELGLKAQKNEG